MSQVARTYELLLVYKPFIDLVDVEQMVTRQYAHSVTLDKHLEADRAFSLGFDPWWQLLLLRSRRIWYPLIRSQDGLPV